MTLLERAQAEPDDPSWEELLRYYEPFINKALRIMGFRGADVDELRQEVNIKLWKGLRSYKRDEARSTFRTWLSRLIRNAALDHLRKTRKQERFVNIEESGVERTLATEAELESRIEAEWQRHIVHLALQRMESIFSGKAVEVFSRMMKGESADQISGQMGIRLHSVYVLKNRVKNRMQQEITALRRELEPLPDEE